MHSRFRAWLPATAAALGAVLLISCGSSGTGGSSTPVGALVVPGPASSTVVSLLAGTLGGPTFADGTGTAARFDEPFAMAFDAGGNMYVSDSANEIVRKITPAGVVTTLAGTLGSATNVNATGTAAGFSSPAGIVVDKNTGTIYLADNGNNAIRKITSSGVVTTFAGSPYGFSGYTDSSTSSLALFDSPVGLAIDGTGNLYVADVGNQVIRKVTPTGAVTTVAGIAGTTGAVNGAASGATFQNATGLAVDGQGNIYVADTGNSVIREINASGVVKTVAGTVGVAGSTDGGAGGLLSNPIGITIDSNGNLDVTDCNLIRQINISSTQSVITTLAGSRQISGAANGSGGSATFNSPHGILADNAGNLYVADTQNGLIRTISSSLTVGTLAGSVSPNGESGQAGFSNGAIANVHFYSPAGLAVDGSGNVYVGDAENSVVRKVSATGVATTLAGLPQSDGIANGPSVSARFLLPSGTAVDSHGNVYVADTLASTVRKISAGGTVTTLAGSAETTGSADGIGSAATFNEPTGIAVDSAGYVYVTDTGNSTIRKISPTGTVSTLAGTVGITGATNGPGTQATFNNPVGIAVDGQGNVYVADTGNEIIREITSTGVVSTIAGTLQTTGAVDGPGSGASFSRPYGLAIDSAGNLFVADTNNNTIREVDTNDVVSTVAGTAGVEGVVTGVGGTLSLPLGIAVDSNENIYVTGESSVLEINFTATPVVNITATPSALLLGQSSTLNWWSSSNTTSCSAGGGGWSGNQNTSGALAVQPTVLGSTSYSLSCSGPGGSGSQSVTVTATAPPPAPVVSLSATPTSITLGQSTTLNWSASNTNSTALPCTASGNWGGGEAADGSFVETPAATGIQTYTLSCVGPGGNNSQSATVTVNSASTTTTSSSTGSSSSHGGAAGLDLLVGLGLLGLWRRRALHG